MTSPKAKVQKSEEVTRNVTNGENRTTSSNHTVMG